MSKMLKSNIYLNDVIKQFLWAQVFLPISTCALSRQMRIDVNYIIENNKTQRLFLFFYKYRSKQTFNMYTTIKYNGRSVFHIMFRLMWGTIFIFKIAKRLGC
jgi:hypothetical protein